MHEAVICGEDCQGGGKVAGSGHDIANVGRVPLQYLVDSAHVVTLVVQLPHPLVSCFHDSIGMGQVVLHLGTMIPRGTLIVNPCHDNAM